MSRTKNDKFDIVYVIAFVAYMILCFLRCRHRFTRRRVAYDTEMDQAPGRVSQGAGLSIDEDRREYIRERIIIKKAERLNDFSIHNDIESNSNVSISDHDVNDDNDDSHGREEEKNEAIDTSSATGIKNIFDNIRDSVMGDSHHSSDDMDNLDSTKTCPICFEEYQIGDEICSSRNDACPHVYHAECLTNWLMKHDDCPLCRADYLHPPGESTASSE